MNQNIYGDILERVQNGEKVCMVTNLTAGKGSITSGLHKNLMFDAKSDEGMQEDRIEGIRNQGTRIEESRIDETKIREVLIHGVPQCTNEGENVTIVEHFYPKERLIILGGGHIAVPLVEFAAKTGFQVTLVDDRPSFAYTLRFPLAQRVICDDFEHAIGDLSIKESDYVVIITRGHRYDSASLRKICQGEEPKYVGMIGSRRRTTIVKDLLEEEGCDHDRLARVHTPIGLNIGAITPEEIAISILSELILQKRLGGGNVNMKNCTDMDYEVLRVLAVERDVPKAIVTVILTKGSVPRGAGAKMIVYRDGRILGSIGGGCSEAVALGDARHMIGSDTFKTVDIDLTGEAAEEEGMVCGGIMTVLIEDYVV